MTENGYIKLFYDNWAAFEPLTTEDRGRLITAIFAFCAFNREPAREELGDARYVWGLVRLQLMRLDAAYREKLARRGAKGFKSETSDDADAIQPDESDLEENKNQMLPTKDEKNQMVSEKTIWIEEQEQDQEQEQKNENAREKSTLSAPGVVLALKKREGRLSFTDAPLEPKGLSP